jgi:hypothetical protein
MMEQMPTIPVVHLHPKAVQVVSEVAVLRDMKDIIVDHLK